MTRDVIESDWDRFPDVPGTHLHWRRRNLLATTHDLVGSDDHELATLETPRVFGGGSFTVWIGERAFQPVGIIGGEWGEYHFCEEGSGASLLKITGRHYFGEASTVITPFGGKALRFPVDTKQWRHAVLSATDQRGKVSLRLRYRKGGLRPHLSSVEAVVSEGERLSTEMIAVVAIASHLVFPGFFDRGSTSFVASGG